MKFDRRLTRHTLPRFDSRKSEFFLCVKTVKKANQLAEDNIKLYPGFYRNMKDNFTAQRGVDPVVTSKCIHSAISARYPGPLLRAGLDFFVCAHDVVSKCCFAKGGWEVVTATWLPWLIPDWVEDDVSAGIFRYDKTGEEKEAGFVTRFKKTIGV